MSAVVPGEGARAAGRGVQGPPGRRLSMRHNFAWTLLASTVTSASKFAMLAILARLAAQEVVGAFSIALAVATLISILSQVQLRVALVTDADSEHDFGIYHALRLLTSSGAVLAAAVVALVAYREIALLVVLIAGGQAVTSVRDIWDGLAQKHERMDISAVGNMLDAGLSAILFCGLFLATGTLEWAAVGLIAARVLVLAAYDMPRVRAAVNAGGEGTATAPRWRLAPMRRLLRVALPLGLTTALISLNSNLPRFFIEGMLGKDALGYFAPIAYFVLLGQLFSGALGRAASPRLARLYRQDRRRYGTLLVELVLFGAVLGGLGVLVAALAGADFLRLVYGAAYARHASLLVLLMVSSGILLVNSFVGVGISAARFFRVQTVTYLAVVLTTVAACAVLIPRLGLGGAAWAMVIASCVNTAINAGVLIAVYRRP